MKKIFTLLVLLLTAIMPVMASEADEALKFFDSYVKAANSYNDGLLNFYSPNAKIIRVVVRPDGTKGSAVFQMKDYATQLRIGQTTAKIRNYKNYYTNRTVKKVANGYKISCLRRPSLDNYKLSAYFVVNKVNGSWKIVEESMDTKVQIFNRYVK